MMRVTRLTLEGHHLEIQYIYKGSLQIALWDQLGDSRDSLMTLLRVIMPQHGSEVAGYE